MRTSQGFRSQRHKSSLQVRFSNPFAVGAAKGFTFVGVSVNLDTWQLAISGNSVQT